MSTSIQSNKGNEKRKGKEKELARSVKKAKTSKGQRIVLISQSESDQEAAAPAAPVAQKKPGNV